MYFYSGLFMVMLVVVCYWFGNVLVNVLGLSSLFIIWTIVDVRCLVWYYVRLCECGFIVFVKCVHIVRQS